MNFLAHTDALIFDAKTMAAIPTWLISWFLTYSESPPT